jgi:hypothetical protein
MARLGKYVAGVIMLGGLWTIGACSLETDGNETATDSDEELRRRRVPCASSDACRPTEFCTTETGDCNPPPGCRRGQICPAVCYGVCRPRREPVECRSDADCRTFSDYCTGCDCRALASGEPDPVCPGPGVQCLIDPCFNQRAACVAGQCELAER